MRTSRDLGTEALPPIVVGVEGSDPGLAATRWAAAEAATRHRRLRVLHAAPPPERARSPATGPPTDTEAILAAAIEVARAEAPQVPVTRHASTGPAAETLVDLSGEAYLVVGHRGHGIGSSLRDLRSPVASHVAAHARGPVAVVRGPFRPSGGGAPIVAGVDGSTASGVALGYAFEEATLRHRALHVVRAWPPRGSSDAGASGEPAGPADLDTVERRLCEWVRPWQDRYPHLPVTFTVATGHPMCALAEASQAASLLVVGARGAGEHDRPLGSVSQQLVHLAACPVAVIRPAPLPAVDRAVGHAVWSG